MDVIPRSDVRYLWHSDYYDGPLSGACLWRGNRYWFVCVDMADDERQTRTFHLIDLTPAEWQHEDAKHALFRECVGHHTDYDPVTQESGRSVPCPRDEWQRFYDAYPWVEGGRPKRAAELRARPAVATYTD